MKFLIWISFLALLLNSCVDKPEVISYEQYKRLNAKMYYYENDTITKYYPDIAEATLNDSVLIISGMHKENNWFSLNTKKLITGTTYFNEFQYENGTDPNCALLIKVKNSYENEYLYCPPYSFLEITEINSKDKTISGRFKIDDIDTYFNNLPYSSSINPTYITQSCYLKVIDTNNSYYTGTYNTNRIDKPKSIIYSNFKYNKVFQSQFYYKENGTHTFTSKDHMYFSYENGDMKYSDPTNGTYVISDTIINKHSYKKYRFYMTLSNSNKTIQIKDGELLLYSFL